MEPTRRAFLITTAGTTSVLLAGCAGDSAGGNAGPTETTTASPTSTATTTAATTTSGKTAQAVYPDYEWSQLGGVEPTATTTITMSAFAFVPLVAAVTPGSEVTVTNEDSSSHTFTAPRLGLNERVGGGESISFPADRTGTFDYVCTLHPPSMLGRLIVTEDIATATQTETPTETLTETPTETTTDTETPTETATDTQTTTGTDSSASVTAADNAFDPRRLSIGVDTTVTWTNGESGYYAADHTVTSAQFHEKAASWSFDAEIAPEERTSYTFDSAGVYEYYCRIHGKNTMCGAVLVGDVSLDQDLPCE